MNDAEIMYTALICATKLSILRWCLRVLIPPSQRKSKIYWATTLVFWFNVLFYASNFLVAIFYCTPRKKIWNPQARGHCVNVYLLIISSAAINAFSDLVIITIPMCVIWRLHMATKRKIGLSIIFAFGILYVRIPL